MEDDRLVYNGNFSDTEIAETWKIRNSKSRWRWQYHNQGGRDEDIYFRFDCLDVDMEEGELRPNEKSEEGSRPGVVSPSITLSEGTVYELSYEIRLFGTERPGKTRFIMCKCVDESFTDISNAVVLERKEWPLDGFQWPVSSVRFTVPGNGKYRFAFIVENDVPINFYWMAIVRIEPSSQIQIF